MTCMSNKTRLYEALGQIVVSFTALERGVDSLVLCSLDSSEAQSEFMVSPMTFQQKVSTLYELIRELHHDVELGALNHTLDALVERCLNCEQQRNEWVRAYWVPEVDNEAGIVMRLMRTSDSNSLEMVPVKVSDLEHFIVVLNATLAYLSGFHQKLSTNFKRVRQLPEGHSGKLELIPNRRY